MQEKGKSSERKRRASSSEIILKKPKLEQKKEVTYVEFLSDYLKSENNRANNATKFLTSYFPEPQNKVLLWPSNNQSVSFWVKNSSKAKYDLDVTLSDGSNDQKLINCSLSISASELRIREKNVVDKWSEKDLYDLINILNYMLRMKISYGKKNADLINFSDYHINPAIPENWFDKQGELAEYNSRYASQFSLLPQFITYHTDAIDHKFWLSWPQKKYKRRNLSLEVTITNFSFTEDPTKDNYYSWLFAESEYLKLYNYPFSPSTLQYYRVTVEECLESENGNKSSLEGSQILDFWFSPDAQFGELRDLGKGIVINGTEGMKIFSYLNEIFRIQDIYLCDASRSSNDDERAPNQIVFRVLMSVAYGSTWYEKQGFEACTFDQLQKGWPGNHKKNLSQNKMKYYEARDKLRALTLEQVYNAFVEEEAGFPARKLCEGEKRSKVLLSLQKKFSGDKSSAMTLGELAAKIYDLYKAKPNSKIAEANLHRIYNLLILPIEYLKNDDYEQFCSDKMNDYYSPLRVVVTTQFFKKSKFPASKPEIQPSKFVAPSV